MENNKKEPKIKKTADMTTYHREYMRAHRLKNPEKDVFCDVCNITIKEYSKNRHAQTYKHKAHEYAKLLNIDKTV